MENSINNSKYPYFFHRYDEERVMHSKSDNIEITKNDKVDEIIEEPFDSLKNRCQNNLGWMKGSEFLFNYIKLLY